MLFEVANWKDMDALRGQTRDVQHNARTFSCVKLELSMLLV